MKSIAIAFAIAATGFAGDPDTVLTRKLHTDAFSAGGRDVAARDATQTITIRGKDKMRIEDGDRVTIVRLDEKKVHFLNTKDKTASTVDLPFDLKKYIPEGGRMPNLDDMPKPTVSVKAAEDTKKVKDWNAKKYVVSNITEMATTNETVWASKDAPVDPAVFHALMSQIPNMRPGGDAGAEERKKIEGFPVLIERAMPRGEQTVKSTEEVTSIEKKEVAANAFDVPADFEKKPFEPRMLGGGMMGGGGRGMGGGRGEGAASRPGGRQRNGAESRPRVDGPASSKPAGG